MKVSASKNIKEYYNYWCLPAMIIFLAVFSMFFSEYITRLQVILTELLKMNRLANDPECLHVDIITVIERVGSARDMARYITNILSLTALSGLLWVSVLGNSPIIVRIATAVIVFLILIVTYFGKIV